jgi:glucokinase
MKLIGVDIGGSHISAASLTFNSGGELSLADFRESSVDTTDSSAVLISAWSAVIRSTNCQLKTS